MSALSYAAAAPLQLFFCVGVAAAWPDAEREGAGARRALCAALAVLAPWVGFLAPPEPGVARVAMAMIGLLLTLRVIDLFRGAKLEGLSRRLWFVTAPFDIRKITPARPTVMANELARIFGEGALGITSMMLVAQHYASPTRPIDWLMRWSLGVVAVYCGVDAVTALIRQGYQLAGMKTPPLHRDPILSRSVQEFWAQRWNLEVHEFLMRECFAPLARARRPRLGVVAAFVGSAVIHVFITVAAAGISAALLMGSFFLTQIIFLMLERRLRIQRAPDPMRRAWTAMSLLLPSPLFVEPLLRALLDG